MDKKKDIIHRELEERIKKKRIDKKSIPYSIREKAEYLLMFEKELQNIFAEQPRTIISGRERIYAYIPTFIAVIVTIFMIFFWFQHYILGALLSGIIAFYFWYYRKRTLKKLEKNPENEKWNEELKTRKWEMWEKWEHMNREINDLYKNAKIENENLPYGYFFESAYVPEKTFKTFVKADSSSIYRFGKEESYEGRDGRTYMNVTRIVGELHLSLRQKNGSKIVSKDELTDANLYEEGFYPFMEYKFDELSPYFDKNKFLCLYCDEEMILEHSEDLFRMSYICDMNVTSQAEKVTGYYKQEIDVEKAVKILSEQFYDETNYLIRDYEDYMAFVMHHTMEKEQNPHIYSEEEIFRNYNDSKESGKYCYVGEEWKIQKKCCVLWYKNKIAAIWFQKHPGSVIKMHCVYDRPFLVTHKYSREEKNIGCRIDGLTYEKAEDYIGDMATTMDYIVKNLKEHLGRVDVMETKPDEIPQELWRIWIQNRYM